MKAPKLIKPYQNTILPMLMGVVSECREGFVQNADDEKVIMKCSQAILAIAQIVDYYPKQTAAKKGCVDDLHGIGIGLIAFAFDLIQNDAEEDDVIERDFKDDIGVDEGLMNADDGAGIGNSTSRIRKSAVALCSSLMKAYPTSFIEYFHGEYPEFNTILRDSDIGVQIDTLNLITTIYQTYTTKIPDEITDLLLTTISQMVHPEQQKSVVVALTSLTNILWVVYKISNENALSPLKSMKGKIIPATSHATIR